MISNFKFSSLELRILRLIHEWTYGHVNMLDENGRDPHGHARTSQNCDIPGAIIKGWMASERDSDIGDCLRTLAGLDLIKESRNKRLPLPNPCYMRRRTDRWIVIIFHGADSNGGFFKVCARRNIANGVVSAGRWHQSIWFEPYGFVVYRLTAKGLAAVRDSKDDVAKGNAGRPVGSFHEKTDTKQKIYDAYKQLPPRTKFVDALPELQKLFPNVQLTIKSLRRVIGAVRQRLKRD